MRPLHVFVAAALVVATSATARAGRFQVHTRVGIFDMPRASATLGRYPEGFEPLPDMVHTPDNGAPEVLAPPERRALVHFEAGVGADEQAALAALGVTVHGHLPEDTLLVSLPDSADAGTVTLAAGLLGPRAAVVQAPCWLAFDPALLAATDGGFTLAPFPDDRPRQLIVEATSAAARAALLARARDAGGVVWGEPDDSPYAYVRMDHAATTQLACAPELLHVGIYQQARTFNDREYSVVQAGPGPTGRSPVWDQGLRGNDEIVAVCDGYFNTNVCFLSGANKVSSLKVYNGATNVANGPMHGTHVAGIVGGDQGGDGLYQTEDGEAPAVTLALLSIGMPDDASQIGPPADYGVLARDADAAGAAILTSSWGMMGNTYGVFQRSIDQAVYNQPGMLVIFANGNSGPNSGTCSAQANSKNLLTIGAYAASAPDDISDYSSRGPAGDGRIRPHLCLPGTRVTSADYAQACGLRVLDGTSMAAPASAAAASMVRQFLRGGFYASGAADAGAAITPSAALMRAMLLCGTQNMTGSSAGGDRPSPGQGFGRLNLSEVLWFKSNGPPSLWLTDVAKADGLATGESRTYALPMRATTELRVVLTWTDPAALAQATQTLVNDLDLVVIAPDGTTYAGNQMSGGVSVPSTTADRLHTDEMVEIAPTQAGIYTIRVVGHQVPQGPQGFSLVVHGGLADRPGDTSWATGDTAPAEDNQTSAVVGLGLINPTTAAVADATTASPVATDQLIYDTSPSCRSAGGAPAQLAVMTGLLAQACRPRRRQARA